MEIHDNKSPVWLSELAEQNFRDEYPQLALLKTHDSWLKILTQNIPQSFLWAIIIFVLGFVLNESFIWQGWVISSYELDSQRVADILASSLEYLAGLVGIVLPVILIIVEFVSKDKGASSLVDIYLDKTDLKTTAIGALILLGIEAFLMAVFRANIIKHPKWLFYLLFLLTLLNLAMIFETGKTIWNLRKSLSNRFLVETLSAKLTTEIRLSQKIEVEYRLGRLTNLSIYQSFGLERSQYGSQPQNTFPILSTKTGMVEDIRLPELQNFAEFIEVSSEKAYMTKLVNDSIQEGEAIAYIPSSMNVHGAELQALLGKAYRVSEVGEISNVNEEVKTLLTQVKQTVETAIREENKLFFDELMLVYQQIFELGAGLPIPPSTEWFSDFIFRGWSANQIAVWHMRDFVEIAARSRNREFIASVSYDIFKISSSMIRNSNVIVDNNLSDVLGLYVFMYIFSYKYENELGINRSYFYLTRNIVDRVWVNNLENSKNNIQAVRNHHTILSHILRTLAKILHEAFLNHDGTTLTSLLNLMQSRELLAHFHLERSFSREHSLLNRLEESTGIERRSVEKQIEALRLIRDIPPYAQGFFSDLVFLAVSYLCESFEKDEITAQQFERTFSIFQPYLVSIEQTIVIFGKLVERDSILGFNLFTRHPDTKRGFSSNDEDKLYLFYCLRGMELLSKNHDAPTTLSMNFKHQLPRLEDTCNRIVEASTKWSQTPLFLGVEGELTESARQWHKVNEELSERWQVEREDQIINSALDGNKEQIFAEAVNQSIYEARKISFQSLLEENDRVSISNDLKKRMWVWHFVEKEFFTELYQDENYSQELGRQYGNGIVRSIDAYLIQGWISNSRYLRSRKDWKTFQPYFERAISEINEQGFQLSYFLVPHSRHLYRWLRNTPGFVEQYQIELENKLPMLEGFYNAIPILSYFPENADQHFLLAVDLERAVQLKIGQPIVEIRNLTDNEIKSRLDKNPNETRRNLFLKISAKASQPFDFEVLEREAIVRMKLKLNMD